MTGFSGLWGVHQEFSFSSVGFAFSVLVFAPLVAISVVLPNRSDASVDGYWRYFGWSVVVGNRAARVERRRVVVDGLDGSIGEFGLFIGVVQFALGGSLRALVVKNFGVTGVLDHIHRQGLGEPHGASIGVLAPKGARPRTRSMLMNQWEVYPRAVALEMATVKARRWAMTSLNAMLTRSCATVVGAGWVLVIVLVVPRRSSIIIRCQCLSCWFVCCLHSGDRWGASWVFPGLAPMRMSCVGRCC